MSSFHQFAVLTSEKPLYIVADVHLGSQILERQEPLEASIIRFLEMLADEDADLLFLGDLFDAWVEYPKHTLTHSLDFCEALQARRARGQRTIFVHGNHDPWHRNYFEEVLGVERMGDAWIDARFGRTVYFNHGDMAVRSRWKRSVHRLIRSHLALSLYTGFVPQQLGRRLAERVSRRISSANINEHLAIRMQEWSLNYLERHSTVDAVSVGHAHKAWLIASSAGVSMNPGAWIVQRCFGRLSASGLELWDWVEKEPQCRAFLPWPSSTP